jgi:hypothetical protein
VHAAIIMSDTFSLFLYATDAGLFILSRDVASFFATKQIGQ